MRNIIPVLLVLSIAACADQSNQAFDMRLRGMAGGDERHLLAN